MGHYLDWLFFAPAGLAVFYMIWVLFKFTEQLAGPRKSAKRADAESERFCLVQTARPERAHAPSGGSYVATEAGPAAGNLPGRSELER